MKKDMIEMTGVVIECLQGATFKVKLESGQVIDAHISGKLRINKIKILINDEVKVELSPYDLTKGRIVWRGKTSNIDN